MRLITDIASIYLDKKTRRPGIGIWINNSRFR